jgi:hypothetical protein
MSVVFAAQPGKQSASSRTLNDGLDGLDELDIRKLRVPMRTPRSAVDADNRRPRARADTVVPSLADLSGGIG